MSKFPGPLGHFYLLPLRKYAGVTSIGQLKILLFPILKFKY